MAPNKDYDSDSDQEMRKMEARNGLHDTWPRFLIVEGTYPERPLSALSPFVTEKGFGGISSTIKEKHQVAEKRELPGGVSF